MTDMTEPLDIGESVPVDAGDLGKLHAMAHGSPGYPESPLWSRVSRVVGWGYNKAGKLVDLRTK